MNSIYFRIFITLMCLAGSHSVKLEVERRTNILDEAGYENVVENVSDRPFQKIVVSEFCNTPEKIYQTYRDDCNICLCVAMLRASCTTRNCDLGSRNGNKDLTRISTKHQGRGSRIFDRVQRIMPSPRCIDQLSVGQVYMDGCSKCKCIRIQLARCKIRRCSDGRSNSTLKRRIVQSEKCTVQSGIDFEYTDGCNNCTCVGIGRARCTSKVCMHDIEYDMSRLALKPVQQWIDESGKPENYQEDINATRTIIVQSNQCRDIESINTTYTDECNTCTCIGVGNARCTIKICDPFSQIEYDLSNLTLNRGNFERERFDGNKDVPSVIDSNKVVPSVIDGNFESDNKKITRYRGSDMKEEVENNAKMPKCISVQQIGSFYTEGCRMYQCLGINEVTFVKEVDNCQENVSEESIIDYDDSSNRNSYVEVHAEECYRPEDAGKVFQRSCNSCNCSTVSRAFCTTRNCDE